MATLGEVMLAGLGVMAATGIIWKIYSDRAKEHMGRKVDEEERRKKEERWEKHKR